MTDADNRRATTQTLPEHTPQTRDLPADADLGAKLAAACEGLSITPDQLRQELETGGDLADVASATLTPKALRLTAENLTVRYPNSNAEVLALLAANPGTTHAITSDDQTDPANVIVHLAIRDVAVCDLRIPKAEYDGLAILEMLHEQNNEVKA